MVNTRTPLRQHGFTIVELLVVIVVIAILAAITIVAYNGVQQRARVATVQSDLEGAAKQLAMDQVINSAYPATVALANNGAGLKASPGTTYQYTVDNSANPQTFCLTGTNATVSYKITQDSTPIAGGCPITNLETNPSFEVNTVGWDNYSNAGTSIDFSRSAVWSNTGAGSIHAKYTITNATDSLGIRGPNIVCSVGDVFTASAYVNIIAASSFRLRLDLNDANGGLVMGPISSSLGVQRVTVTGTIPAGVTMVRPLLMVISSTANETVEAYMDSIMVQKASSANNYADGNSPNWIWNGTANASTSTGPPL